MRPQPPLPPEIEDYRDQRWCREATRQVESARAAERFIEQVGFTACLTEAGWVGPAGSLRLRRGTHERSPRK
jgi:hypothetical protein